MRACKSCGASLEGRNPRVKFCDRTCKNKHHNNYRPVRGFDVIQCEFPDCDIRFRPTKKSQKYCSRQCKDIHRARKQRAEEMRSNWHPILEPVIRARWEQNPLTGVSE